MALWTDTCRWKVRVQPSREPRPEAPLSDAAYLNFLNKCKTNYQYNLNKEDLENSTYDEIFSCLIIQILTYFILLSTYFS